MKSTLSRVVIALLLLTMGSFGTKAQTLIDTGEPAKVLRFGVRIGFTSSNLTNNYDASSRDMKWKNQGWKNGFTVGGVVDINIRNYFAIQPGLFFVSRGNTYNMLISNDNKLKMLEGKCNANYWQVPIMFSFRLGVAELAQLHIDVGPYFASGFWGKNKYSVYGYEMGTDATTSSPVIIREDGKQQNGDYFGDKGIAQRYDSGIKFGVGIQAMGNFYVGAHYEYSLRNVLRDSELLNVRAKGHNKIWNFTLGYNF